MLGCGPCVCRTLQCRRYASENCGCWEGYTEDITNYILNWFKWTSVFNDLTPEQKEQSLADAQEIIEWAGDGIIPFYNAVRQWRTFANYVEKLWLTVDESGPCDSSLYEDDEAFIIYISTAGAIHCKYLALVAQRGRTPNKKLANAEEISDYLDWVTTEAVTYQFKDWDNEILSFWSVKKWETPEAPEDPSREGYTFTGWSPEIDAISRDTTFVAQYEKAGPIYVQSISNLPQTITALEGSSTTFTFDYLPADAEDFSNVSLVNSQYTSSSISYQNWTATVTVQWLDYTTTAPTSIGVELDSVSVWSVSTEVRPYGNVTINPVWAWSVSPNIIHVPYSWVAMQGSNPYEVDIYDSNQTIVSTIELTVTPNSGYTFSDFENIGSDWFFPQDGRECLQTNFNNA